MRCTMLKSACLKVIFEGGNSIILRFKDFDFSPLLLSNPDSSLGDFITMSLLSPLFPTDQSILPNLPRVDGSSAESSTYIGSGNNHSSYQNHPTESVSFVGFNEELIKKYLVDYYGSAVGVESAVMGNPLTGVQAALNDLGFNDLSINPEPTVTTFSRCTPEEITELGNSTAPYEDGFDLVRDRLSNLVGVLETDGFEVAKFSPSPDKILFRSDCYLEEEVKAVEGLVFSVREYFKPERHYFELDFLHRPTGDWSLVDLDSGEVLADHTGFALNNGDVEVSVSLDGYDDFVMYIYVERNTLDTKNYQFTGDSKGISFWTNSSNYYFYDKESTPPEKLVRIIQWSDKVNSLRFDVGISDIEVPETLLPNIDSLESMFHGVIFLNSDITRWDTSNITNMRRTFSGFETFDQDISGWDTSKVTDMEGMLYQCEWFEAPIGNWDVSKVTNMANLFGGHVSGSVTSGASRFNESLLGWDVSSVTNMDGMFNGCKALNQDLNSWDVSNVTNMSRMFLGATAFNGDITNWNTSSLLELNDTFYMAESFNREIGNWDVSKVTSFDGTFSYATSFNADISSWDVSSATSLARMFEGTPFNQDISGWDISNVYTLYQTFSATKAFNVDISSWNVSNVQSIAGIFANSQAFNRNISGWNVSKVSGATLAFWGAERFNQDLSSWCVRKIKSLPARFSSGATQWTLPQPVWGKCPRNEDGLNT